MSEHVRERLLDEMGQRERPPVDGLVAAALERGRHQRRVRRVAAGAGTTAVVGVTVLAVTVGAALPRHSASTAGIAAGAGGTAAVAVSTATATTTTAIATATTAAPAVPKATTKSPARVTSKAAAPTGAGSKDVKVAAGQAWRALQQAASAANPPQWTTAPAGVAATPQGELQLFTDLVKPYGTAGYFGVAEGSDRTAVRAHLTLADGSKGQVNFSLTHDTLGRAGDCLKAPASFEADYGLAAPAVTCHDSADGGYIVSEKVNAGCLEDQDLKFVHPDGTQVAVTIATCQTDNANNLTPGSRTLTADEAEKIFTNTGFDFTMPADVVDRGAANIGDLATFH